MQLKAFTAISSTLPNAIWAAAAMHEARGELAAGRPKRAQEITRSALNEFRDMRVKQPSSVSLHDVDCALEASLLALLATSMKRSGGDGGEARSAAAEARRSFEAGLREESNPAGSFVTDYVVLLAEFGDMSEALNILEHGIRPAGASAYRNVAAVLVLQDDFDSAARLLTRAVAIDPSPPVFIELGDALLLKGDHRRAFQSYLQAAGLAVALEDSEAGLMAVDRSIRLRPDSTTALCIRGALRWKHKNLIGAAEDFRAAIASADNRAGPRIALARVELQLNRPDETLADLDPVLATDPANPDALWLRAEAQLSIGDREASDGNDTRVLELWTLAKRGADASLASRDSNVACVRTRGMARCRLGEYEEAKEDLRRVLTVDPADIRAHGCLAEALLATGEYDAALSNINLALALPGEALGEGADQAWLLGVKAKILAQRQEWQEEAIQTFERALDFGIKDVRIYREFVELLGKKSDWNRLARVCRLVSERLGPDSEIAPRYRKREIAALRRIGEHEEGFHALSREPALSDSDPEVVWLRARLLSDIGYFERAYRILPSAQLTQDRDAGIRVDQLSLSGWIVQNLEPATEDERIRNAEQDREFYAEALRIIAESSRREPLLGSQEVWVRKGLANALVRLPNQQAKAYKEYMRVIEQCHRQIAEARSVNPHTFCLVGWCHYCRREFGEALRFYRRARREGTLSEAAQLDYGLVLLAAREEAAVAEYEAALEAVRAQKPFRRAGLLRIALHDIRELVFRTPGDDVSPYFGEVWDTLSTELRNTLPILEAQWPEFASCMHQFLQIAAIAIAPREQTAARV